MLPLNPIDRLADPLALAVINEFMNERDCVALYGQHRFASGHFGIAFLLLPGLALSVAPQCAGQRCAGGVPRFGDGAQSAAGQRDTRIG